METFLEVNDAYVELSGYSRDELLGRTHRQLQQWSSPEDLAKLRRLGEEPFRDQEFSLRTRRGEVRTVPLSREIIDLGDARYSVVRDSDERGDFYVLTLES